MRKRERERKREQEKEEKRERGREREERERGGGEGGAERVRGVEREPGRERALVHDLSDFNKKIVQMGLAFWCAY